MEKESEQAMKPIHYTFQGMMGWVMVWKKGEVKRRGYEMGRLLDKSFNSLG
jgi:hypothetical protein